MSDFKTSSATNGTQSLAVRLGLWAGIVGPVLYIWFSRLMVHSGRVILP